jgi:hypothetical protein
VDVLLTSTSYPRDDADWQGLFIKRIVEAMSTYPGIDVAVWAPRGPLPEMAQWTGSDSDARFFDRLTTEGGIAHLLRNHPARALIRGGSLLARLQTQYRRSTADVFHINWLQNALPLIGLRRRAVITVLGTDFALLDLRGMQAAMRLLLKTNDCILAPNAPWMEPGLRERFGDLAPVKHVNFGIDQAWYDTAHVPDSPETWLAVTRVTEGKIGDLFSWGQGIFGKQRRLKLVGPMQEEIALPDWVEYCGPATPQQLQTQLMPGATGLVSLSRHAEGRPQIMLEAMAAGLPIVASDLDAHRSLITDGSDGIIVKTRVEFQNAVDLLASNEQANEYSERARASASAHFGLWSDCVSRYHQLYQELM